MSPTSIRSGQTIAGVDRERRRAFALGAALLAAPLNGLAQQPQKVWRVGILVFTNWERQFDLLRDSLRELGLVEGQNIRFELRDGQGNTAALPALAAELAHLNVDAILTIQTPAAHAAKAATASIPIVAWAADLVGTGVIASLARPGGNITGVSITGTELAAKNLELLRELLPAARRVGVLANAGDPFTPVLLKSLNQAGALLGIELRTTQVRAEADYEAAFTGWLKPRVDAVFHQPSLPSPPAIALALRHRLPTLSFDTGFSRSGGLLSYSGNLKNVAQRAAYLLNRILKGDKPANLPAEQPTHYDLKINLKTARALGVKVPSSLLNRADEVIE